MAPRRPRPGPGQQSFDFGAGTTTPTTPTTKRTSSTPTPRTSLGGRRNLRALSVEQVREPLPNLLPFDSSRIMEAGYSSRSKTLYVRFVDGTPWHYRGVEPSIWRNFRRSASPGRYVNRVLNNYSYGPIEF